MKNQVAYKKMCNMLQAVDKDGHRDGFGFVQCHLHAVRFCHVLVGGHLYHCTLVTSRCHTHSSCTLHPTHRAAQSTGNKIFIFTT